MEADIADMKATITTSPPGSITYSTVCNHLSTSVSQLPEFIARSRNVSSTATEITDDGKLSCYKDDRTLILDQYLPDWMTYPDDVKKTILSERSRLGVKLGRGGRGNRNYGTNQSELSKIKKENSKFKRTIKALKKLTNSEDTKDDDNENSEEEEENDAGDQFGGKNSKKKSKKE